MDFELCSRIWDNFILDKEIYAMRVGLAILKLFESRFLKVGCSLKCSHRSPRLSGLCWT